jgi:WD40 repeat protein
MFATYADGVLRVWDVGAGGTAEVAALPEAIGPAAPFVDADRILTVGERSPVVWDLTTGRVRPFGPPFSDRVDPDFAPPLEVSSDRSRLAMVENDRVSTWSAGSLRPASVLPFQGWFDAWLAGWSGDEPVVANPTGPALTLVDGSGREVAELSDPGFHVSGVTMSDDGRLSAVSGRYGDGASWSGRIKIWDLRRGEIVTEIEAAGEYVLFDRTAGRILFDGADGPEIRDVRSGRLLRTLPPQPGGVYSLAFAPDGSVVAVGADDDIVRLYDATTGELLSALRGHRCTVGGLSFSPDGSLLASTACDGVRVWALDIDRLLDVARANVTRSLTADECRTYLHLDACPARPT